MIMRMWINMMIMMRGIMRRVWIMIEDDGFNQLILFYRIHLKRSIIVFINENKDTNNDDNLIIFLMISYIEMNNNKYLGLPISYNLLHFVTLHYDLVQFSTISHDLLWFIAICYSQLQFFYNLLQLDNVPPKSGVELKIWKNEKSISMRHWAIHFKVIPLILIHPSPPTLNLKTWSRYNKNHFGTPIIFPIIFSSRKT